MLLALAALLTATVVAADPVVEVPPARGTVVGTVTLTDARGETFDAPGVELTLVCEAAPEAVQVASSDDGGAFRFADVPTARCEITADLQGFGVVTESVVVRADETQHVAIHLDIAATDTGVDVGAKGGSTPIECGEANKRPRR